MHIRMAREDDREQVRNMWAYAFNDTESFLNWYFANAWGWENAVVASSGRPYSAYVDAAGRQTDWLCGSLEMVPYTLSVRGQETAAAYIVGVSVLPEVRGEGVAKKLLQRALEEQAARGHIVSLLLPFSYAFYRKAGYETAYALKYLDCPFASLRPLSESYGRMVRATPAHMDTLDALYRRSMTGRSGYIVRDAKCWQFIFDTLELTGGYIYMVQNEYGEAEGYVTFSKSRERLRVKEMAYDNPSALRALVGFIASHFSVYDTVRFDLPDTSPLPFMLDDPRAACTISPFLMARVVDAGAALSRVALSGAQFTIRLRDEFFPKNDGVYTVSGGRVERVGEAAALRCDIGTFSQMYMGFLSPTEAAELGRLEVSDFKALRDLERCCPKQKNTINHILTDDL